MKNAVRNIAATGILSLALLGAAGVYAQPGGPKGDHADMELVQDFPNNAMRSEP